MSTIRYVGIHAEVEFENGVAERMEAVEASDDIAVQLIASGQWEACDAPKTAKPPATPEPATSDEPQSAAKEEE